MSHPPNHPYFLAQGSQPHLSKVVRALANRSLKSYLVDDAKSEVAQFTRGFLRSLAKTAAREARVPFQQSAVLDAMLVGEKRPVAPLLLAATTHLERPLSAPLEFDFEGNTWHDPVRGVSVVSERLQRVRVCADRVELVIEGGGPRACVVSFHAGQRMPQVDTLYPVDDVQIVWTRTHGTGLPGVPTAPALAGPAHRKSLTPLREAAAVLCAALPEWTQTLATTAQRVDLVDGVDNPWVPRRIAVPSDLRRPLEVAEAVIRSEQENRVRCTGLLAPLGRVEDLVAAAGNAAVAALYTQMITMGHPRLDGPMLARRDQVLAELKQQIESLRVTQAGLTISGGLVALDAWCRTIPSRAVPQRAVAKSRRMLVVSLDFDDFVYSWMVEHRLVEAAARRGHVVDLVAIDPMKNRDVGCELGFEQVPPTVFDGSAVRFPKQDPEAVLAAIDKLLAEHEYDGVFLNTPASVLQHLVDHPAQPLRNTPICAYDRHLHNDAKCLHDDPTKANLAAHNVRLFCLQSNILFPEPRNTLAGGGLTGDRLEHNHWPIDLGFLAPAAVPPTASTEALKIFTGGNSVSLVRLHLTSDLLG